MKNSRKISNTILILIALAFLSASYLAGKKYEKPFIFISKQDSGINLNDAFLSKFNLGYKRLISSIMWISTIIESDIDHYKKKDLNSWMFLRFNTISLLEPDFFENYSFGGMYLSIIKDDIPGASTIYQKGLKLFPNNLQLYKDAGFHFYFEAHDFKESYRIYKHLIELKDRSPITLNTFSRLEAQAGNLTLALKILDDFQTRYPPNTLIGFKIQEHRYSIKAEIDLDCLNRNNKISNKDCATKDLNGDQYIIQNGIYVAPIAWKAFRAKTRKQ